MFRIWRFTYFLCVMVLWTTFSSCTANAGNGNTEFPHNENADLSTLSPTSIPSDTSTPEEISTATSSDTLPAVKTQCVNKVNESQKVDLQGVIVLKLPDKQMDSQAIDESGQQPVFDFGFYFFNPDNKQIIQSITEGLLEQVSPDGKYLAYIHYDSSGDQKFLGILDSNGKLVSDFSLFIDGGWQSYFNWQNSKQIRLVAAYGTVEIRLLDPLTKLHFPLRNEWDKAYSPENPYEDKIPDWKFDGKATKTFDVYGANILYDPSLNRVFYPKDDGIVSLVNVETETELASTQFTDWGRLPYWSPNGEYLTILNHEGIVDEFYLISKDGGEFQRITNFAEEIGFATISEYTWSPDSTQIAFWLNTGQEEVANGKQSELAIMDIASKQVTRLCIQGISTNAYAPWSMLHPEPVWSPDGKYIMFTQWDEADNPGNYYVLVVDPVTGELENISQNTAPIGWMTSEP